MSEAKYGVYHMVDKNIKHDFIVTHFDYLANQAIPAKNKAVVANFMGNLLSSIKLEELDEVKVKLKDLFEKSYFLRGQKIDEEINEYFNEKILSVENEQFIIHPEGYDKKIKAGVDYDYKLEVTKQLLA